MNARPLTVALLVVVGLLLFVPLVVVACSFLFTEGAISWHTVYGLVGALVLLAVLVISWRHFRLP